MKLPALALAFFFFANGTSFGRFDLGSPSSFTPYDPYLAPVKQVLGALPETPAPMKRVQALMREGRSFRYVFSDPYVATMPAVTAARKCGDCKAKSLWLCNQLRDGNVRYVIGKVRRKAKLSHAWLIWQNQGRWWILDCTNKARPIPAESVSRDEYIPLYSYDKSSAYRHSSTPPMTAAIATKHGAVAAKTRSR
jgi:hypothetical protein